MNCLKKILPLALFMLFGVIIGVLVSSAFFATTGYSIFGRAPKELETPSKANNAELAAIAFSVVKYISNGDYAALSSVAHPDFGVVLSPSATVNFSTNKRFNAEQIGSFGTDSNAYVWGVYDGSGEPIEMTPTAYFAEFVFSKNYCESPIIGINRIVKSGNALENITDEFPGVRFVDFHIPGGEKDSPEDIDWGSLRLGFEEYDGRLWLTLILNSRWTV